MRGPMMRATRAGRGGTSFLLITQVPATILSGCCRHSSCTKTTSIALWSSASAFEARTFSPPDGGLIDAAFLTPAYDITFSAQADRVVRRRKRDAFCDLSLLPAETTEQVVCFAGKEYVPLFAALTGEVRGERVVFYNSAIPPSAPGCKLVRFETLARTNWQYECAVAFLSG